MKHIIKSGFVATAVVVLLACTGCFTVSKTTIVTPAVFNVSKDASGALATNQVAASSTTTTHKARTFLPDGYALMGEEDVYGFSATLSSYSSTFPNVKLGLSHSTFRLIPTSTNAIYAPNISEAGQMNNKAVPFFFGLNGQFASGSAFVSQATGTNGPAIISTTVIPAAGATH